MNTETHIAEVNVRNFQTEVAERSQNTPVILEFYAQGAQPSEAAAALLRKLSLEYQGKFFLARVNVQESPQLVQQLGVRTLPTLKIIFQGQLAGEMEGPLDENKLRGALDQLTMSPLEQIREQIDALIETGDRESAISLLQQLINEEPQNIELQTELSDLLIMSGRSAEGREILAGLPADAPGIQKPRARLEFIDLADSLPDIKTLRAQLEADNSSLPLRFNLAIGLIVDDQIEGALEELLNILKADKLWEEEKARKTMIKVFDMLGKGNELATSYRRKMFTFLH